MPFGVHVYNLRPDDTLELIWANDRSDQILNVDNKKYLGMTLEEIFPQFRDTEIPARYLRTARTGEPWIGNQVFLQDKSIDGAFEVVAFQVESEMVAVVFRDITRRKTSEMNEKSLRKDLEQQVAIRTRDLQKSNRQLKEALSDRGNAEMAVRQRLAMERLVTQLALRFINVPSDSLDDEIVGALGEIGEFSKVDRVYMTRVSEGALTASIVHQWTPPGDMPFKGDQLTVSLGSLPLWRDMIRRNRVVYVPDVSGMPSNQTIEKKTLESRMTRSILAVPLQFGGDTLGFLGLESTRRNVTWTREDSTIMTAIGTVLVNALERAKAERLLKERAIQDPLTGLLNHRYILQMLSESLQDARSKGRALTVALCDFDDFKGINDRHGHQIGDEVLIDFSRILKEELRETDLAGRCGGDEFLLLFPATADFQARAILERIRSTLANIHFKGAEDRVFTTSFTFGMAGVPPNVSNPEELFSAADKALYGAKKPSGNHE